MNVLVIPEDFRHDQYILEPVVSGVFSSLGKDRARIRACRDPLLGGVGEVFKRERIQEIVQRYDGMVDIYIVCVDRDGDPSRERRLAELRKEFSENRHFLTVNAIEEIESWALAGLTLPKEWRWQDVRQSISVKEEFFEPLARSRGLSDAIGHGRKILGIEAARSLENIIAKCPEDVGRLREELKRLI